MTSAPSNLLAARRLLIDHLNIVADTVRDDDLEPGEVGIVGDPAHRGGYHCGSDRVVTNDYSVVESKRDSAGLTLFASALDVGIFEVRSGGRTHNLRTFSTWCVAQCVANTPDSRDIREVIYSPDGKVVRRFDRLGRRSSGDDSHLYHTHFSYFRDSTRANRDQTPLFRRYLTTIGLLPGGGQFLMFCKQGDAGEHVQSLQYRLQLLGYYKGALDGAYGPATTAAVKACRAVVGSKQDGTVYDAHAQVQIDLVWARKFGGEPGIAALAGRVKALEDRQLPPPTGGVALPAQVVITGTLSAAE
ncbi:peptidoglycan-binding protein [Micromonospora sp. 4G55]|uniref:peptidoglycan-binding domain-containing protein n=1 Tax=Micromonospora sp. 4G55 TaxID=2806102 RepID=UPI001A3F3586|nr:peptidoglycan-binding protein [Micromonospora sp. 4G55]MBM0257039.1 peptidoglycan-binding protein [Micromonospora sp. 4G55]